MSLQKSSKFSDKDRLKTIDLESLATTTCTLSNVDWASQWLTKPYTAPDKRTDKEKVWDALSKPVPEEFNFGGQDFTISAWIKLVDTAANTAANIVRSQL